MKTVWVFPGQGSQALGMGADLPAERLTAASDLLGWSVSDICQNDAEKLNNTRYTQPCLYVVESILVDLLHQQGQQPSFVAGHSLGEYVALYAAGVFSFETGLALVKRRAELMDGAAGGKMMVLMGFDRAELINAIDRTDDVVLANDNSAAQVVISGSPAAVDTVVSKVKTKRAILLNVSGAFHSHLMADAATEFAELLDQTEFANAKVPVLSNVEPHPSVSASELKDRLTRQMTGSVRWLEICQQFKALDIEQAIEIGPGKVLAGLIKRTCSGLLVTNISQVSDCTLTSKNATGDRAN
jgi:[acyl-carrier-protein] S-malonyltransferase